MTPYSKKSSIKKGEILSSSYILVAEDDQGLNYLIQKTLQRNGIRTSGVFNGTDAVARVTEEPDTLLLLDYRLPDMTGDQVINHLLEKRLNVPFIVFTGHGDQKKAVNMMKLGARDYIVKSTTLINELPLVVNRALNDLKKERKLAEATEALREGEEKYHQLFESASDAVIIYDAETLQIEEANNAALTLFGYSRKEIPDLNVRDVTVKKDKVLLSLQKNTVGASKRFNILKLKKKNGTTFYGEISEGAYVTAGQKKIIGSIRDMTERKKAEDDLRKFRMLVNQSNDSLFIIDPETGRIIDMNEKACSSLGYEREELLSMKYTDLDEVISDKSTWEKHSQKLRKKGSMLLEVSHKKKDGASFPVEQSTRFVRIADSSYFIAVARDITKRKLTEERLQQSEANLQEKNMALEQKNIALKEMIEQISIERNRLKDDITINIENNVMPILSKLKLTDDSVKHIELLKYHYKDLSSSFGRKVADVNNKLTPKEVEICNMIRGGLSSKEICNLLFISSLTVEKHRGNIRKKLGLSNEKVNLASYLNSL